MKAFSCHNCGQLLFFENSVCLRCGSSVGLAPSELDLVELGARQELRVCANQVLGECNWLVEPSEEGPLCRSCALTRTRPSDDDLAGLPQFARAEGAKRRLLFELLELGLPIGSDLQFDLLSSSLGPVVTGHMDGLITIDLAESDDARRAQRQAELAEPYRTLLGHFRHEIGHYYFPVLVEQAGCVDAARALFGDERSDYQAALERHYAGEIPADWAHRYVSSYATMHPSEDWAETFAHYLHIRDTLETADAFGISVGGPRMVDGQEVVDGPPGLAGPGGSSGSAGHGEPLPVADPEGLEADLSGDAVSSDVSFDTLLDDWLPLTYALNAVNRSMGQHDLYPFTLAPLVIEKLTFVHERVVAIGEAV